MVKCYRHHKIPTWWHSTLSDINGYIVFSVVPFFSSTLCYIFFFRGGKGGGGDLPNATDFRAVHWGSDSMSEAGSEASSQAISEAVSEAVGEILADAAAPAIAGAGAAAIAGAGAAIAGAGAAIAGNVVVDPVLAASLASKLDLYAFAALDPIGYNIISEGDRLCVAAYEMCESALFAYLHAVGADADDVNVRREEYDRLDKDFDSLSKAYHEALRSANEVVLAAQGDQQAG